MMDNEDKKQYYFVLIRKEQYTMRYRHTHIGYLIIVTAGITLLFSLGKPWSFLAIALAVGCFTLFPIQTIEIVDSSVIWHFGLGLVRRQVHLSQIKTAVAAKNRWLGTWNIRHIIRYLVFFLSGVDAVELELDSGQTIWLGTDQPEELTKVIQMLQLQQPGTRGKDAPVAIQPPS